MKIIWTVLDDLLQRGKMAWHGQTPPSAIDSLGVEVSDERMCSMESGRSTAEITPEMEGILTDPLNTLAYQIHLDRCKQAGQTVHGMNNVDWSEAKAQILAEMNQLGLTADEYLAMYNNRRQQIEIGSNGQPVQAIITDETGDATRQEGSRRTETATANT